MPSVHRAIHKATRKAPEAQGSLSESGLWGRVALHVLGEAAERGLCGIELPGAPPNPIRQLWGAPVDRRRALAALSRSMRAPLTAFSGQVELCKGCQTNVARMAAKAARKGEAK